MCEIHQRTEEGYRRHTVEPRYTKTQGIGENLPYKRVLYQLWDDKGIPLLTLLIVTMTVS